MEHFPNFMLKKFYGLKNQKEEKHRNYINKLRI